MASLITSDRILRGKIHNEKRKIVSKKEIKKGYSFLSFFTLLHKEKVVLNHIHYFNVRKSLILPL